MKEDIKFTLVKCFREICVKNIHRFSILQVVKNFIPVGENLSEGRSLLPEAMLVCRQKILSFQIGHKGSPH